MLPRRDGWIAESINIVAKKLGISTEVGKGYRA